MLLIFINIPCRVLQIVVFLLTTVPQLAFFMVFFCIFKKTICLVSVTFMFLVTNIFCWHSDILVDFFLRQFCDAHTCSGKRKPFSKGGKVRLSFSYCSSLDFRVELCLCLIIYVGQTCQKNLCWSILLQNMGVSIFLLA